MHLFSFRKLIAPALLKILYVLGLGVLFVAAVIYLSRAFALISEDPVTGFGWVLALLFGTIVAALIWRVLIEVLLIPFAINEKLAELVYRDRL